ncbi:alpha/beta fold hydrolase [Chloroflexota bacterium]
MSILQEHLFNTGEVSINYGEGPPSGPPLVLLHGGGNRWQSFLPIIPGLAKRWHVYALDLRGHGRSDRVPGQQGQPGSYRPEHYAADVFAFCESRVSEPAVLFGHSRSGWVALLAGAKLGEKLRGLILGDPPLDIDRFIEIESSDERVAMWRAMRELLSVKMSVLEMAAALAATSDLDSVQLHDWAETLSQVDPDVIFHHAEKRLIEYVENIDLDRAFGLINSPTLVLQGDPAEDGLIADGDVEHILSLLPDGLHVKLEGAGHDLGLSKEKASPLLPTVKDFLEGL